MPAPPSGKTVLVVEDNKSTRDIVVHNLNAAGFRTVEAADGEQALAAASRSGIDLVLLDIMMPKLDGFEVCRRLRQGEGPAANVPVIIVTAKSEREDVVHAMQSGANDYIVKPFTRDTLLTKVRKLLDKTDPRRPDTKSGSAVTDPKRPDTKSGPAAPPA